LLLLLVRWGLRQHPQTLWFEATHLALKNKV